MCDKQNEYKLDIDKQILHVWKIETAPKQNNVRLCECDFRVLKDSCDVVETGSKLKHFCRTKFFARNTSYDAFVIVIPSFSESQSDIWNDIPSVSGDIHVQSSQ